MNSNHSNTLNSLIEAQPLIDLRPASAYSQGHLENATSLPWPDLQSQLNELPSRPADLFLLGDKTLTQAAQIFLEDKGYRVKNCFQTDEFDEIASKLPGLVKTGQDSVILWQPCGLVKAFNDLRLKHEGEKPQPGSVQLKGLDIGCGGGRDSVFLGLNHFKMTAIDHKESVLQRARQLAKRYQVAIDFRACDVGCQGCLPEEKQDLVLVVRFLNRPLLKKLKAILKPGGWLVYQTFSEGCETFGSPKNPNFILRKNELAEVFSAFEVFVDRIDTLKDGRPVASFIARKGN